MPESEPSFGLPAVLKNGRLHLTLTWAVCISLASAVGYVIILYTRMDDHQLAVEKQILHNDARLIALEQHYNETRRELDSVQKDTNNIDRSLTKIEGHTDAIESRMNFLVEHFTNMDGNRDGRDGRDGRRSNN